MTEVLQLKQLLYELCKEYVSSGVAAARQAIDNARDAADDDTKSSAGDKFETAREIMQQDIDLNTAHLNELQKLKASLDLIDPAHHSDTVHAGSVVHTNQGNYYIAISIGKLTANDVTYYAISPSAPLGALLIGHKAGDTFSFNGKDFTIKEIL